MKRKELHMYLVRGRERPRLLLQAIFFFAAFFVMFLCTTSHVHADGVARAPKNGVEAQRASLCGTPGISVFGAVWINDVWPLDQTDARWAESVNVGPNDTSIDAWMWTTAYNCSYGSPISNVQIISLGSPPAPASPVTISFPYGDTINRGSGTTYPGQFTDPPGALKVKLDISNQPSGCYDVAYNGTYQDSGGTGFSKTYFTSVCINRPIPAGTIYTTKYYPENAGLGDLSKNTPEVNNAGVCLTNKYGTTFACDASNPWAAGGILVSDNDYRVSVDVPNGYKLNKTNRGSASCTNPNGVLNTGSCSITLTVQGGVDNFVDFWFESLTKSNSDSVSDCTLVGWAFDGDKTDQSLYLDVWIGDANGNNMLPEPSRHYYLANQPRGDINAAFGVKGDHGYVINLPAKYYDGLTHKVDIWTYGINAAGQEDNGNMQISGMPTTFTCPIRPACSGNISPLSVEPNQSFTLIIPVAASGNAPPPPGINFSVAVTAAGIFPGTLTQNGNISSTNATNVSIGNFTIASLGVRTVNYTITFPGVPSVSCSGELTVAAKPIFSVTQGDIASGFSSGTPGWAASTSSNLVGWFDKGKNLGSGTTLATLALTKIEGVRSAQQLPGLHALDELSFSNDSSMKDYGGGYTTINLPKNYYGQLTASMPTLPISNITDAIASASSSWTANGPFVIDKSKLTSGHRIAIFVNGDVRIIGDVILDQTGVSSPSQLANFYLVTNGNIYIDPGVTRLDGVYIAQDSGTSGSKGQIYTCANLFNPPTASMVNSDASICRQKPLTVNGAFIADKINLYRSAGSLSDNPAKPAETFNYTPAVWLAPPPSISQLFTGGTGTSGKGGGYDAITPRQPVL